MEPKVGMPATLSINGDEYPCTVVRVGPSGRVCWVQKCFNLDGTDEYDEPQRFQLLERGWRRRGHYVLSLGERRSHRVREF